MRLIAVDNTLATKLMVNKSFCKQTAIQEVVIVMILKNG